MKKVILIAFATVLCAGGASAQNTNQTSTSKQTTNGVKSTNGGTNNPNGQGNTSTGTNSKSTNANGKDPNGQTAANSKNKKYIRPSDQGNPKNTDNKHHGPTAVQQQQSTNSKPTK